MVLGPTKGTAEQTVVVSISQSVPTLQRLAMASRVTGDITKGHKHKERGVFGQSRASRCSIFFLSLAGYIGLEEAAQTYSECPADQCGCLYVFQTHITAVDGFSAHISKKLRSVPAQTSFTAFRACSTSKPVGVVCT